MNNCDDEQIINVGMNEDVSIKQLAEIVKDAVGFEGELRFDTSKPDGTPRKLLDVSKLAEAGWTAKIDLYNGVKTTYAWFQKNIDKFRT